MATASCVWWRGCQLSRIRGTNTPSRRRGGSSLRHPTPMWSTSNTCRGCTRARRSWRGRRGKGSGRTRRPLATIRSLPRDARLWHHQVGKTRPQAETLRWLRQNQKGEVHESVDLRNLVGDTTIIGWPACSDGPWRRRGGALTLPVFFSPPRLSLLRPGVAVPLPQLPEGNQDQRPLLGVKGSESRGLGSDGGLRSLGSQESQ